MTYPLDGFDAVHASPPCQAYSAMRTNWNARSDHPELVEPMRERLRESGVPWVMENVPGAPMAPLFLMCGSAFGLGIPGYQLRRHRWFEVSGFWAMSLPCQHRGPVIGIYGDHGRDHRRKEGYGRYFTLDERKAAMGIDWMARGELDQAIPPAYTEFIGCQLLECCVCP
jgi:DNA (cytosine-5)-methyltransferase 1